MGFSKKHQVDGESLEGKKWVIAGITMRAPLKTLSTRRMKEDDENSNSGNTTPTSKDSRIPEVMTCPPPPRKRRPVVACHNHTNMEFFTSPELDNLFQLLSKSK
ncbi:putative cyclin-dependent protein kinase inhibitor SMR [Helianthus annuus]|uniref:Cyclin-dependent protein kinase inhibitor SMR n=1 Tax=Helianthus annuus TaxID=4232 RepID=A0A251SBE9_HELAN|nr:cyclin-dependent protein kinase inhibitor SMR6 [Helianthus annuus]KAF5763888.1 putative cyclin-dependent protein kinase inhibitor SMR [Helianthus annuus]KAJ0450650.1 putative cyclin-dependent protein kinase inhibitor SMR [Helianthus annuus]KAJ0454880.1 putative cyclin-dependent protein kinase inhibitor SMR [Helianthus annuus]KAJ0472497.1 putative cyclin-dependent protein kinase inhibitor SMR [Helianthus annuus]KAJ0648098.1 putative cyclin-dependent protein kinase inhibitor SMR [Helianthus a